MSLDLDTQEVKDAIAAAVEEATGGLKTKNAELLGKLKKAQAGSTIDPADFDAIERERDQLKADLVKAQRDVTKAKTDADNATKALDVERGNTSKLLVEQGLTDALVKAGVTNPVHQKAAKAMLASQVQIADDNGAKVPKVGDKALSDYITEWAGSDEGKHFVAAPASSGGGAHNSGQAPAPSSTLTSTQKIAAGLAKL